jgi:integrase
MGVVRRTPLERHDSITQPFGHWPIADITPVTVAQFQERRKLANVVPPKTAGRRIGRQTGGVVAANRNLGFLRAAFNWAIRNGLIEKTPFRRGTESALKMDRETGRSRRLEDGEGERLLAACGPHLRALVEAALETGCRMGELLSLQVWQIRNGGKRPELFLPATKTKTAEGRTVPLSSRMRAVLEMRRLDPAGEEHGPKAYVFGNEIGQRVTTVKTAWRLACKRAGIEGLHFHDLRREAGSRWVEGGVPLHTVRDWLGHSNIEQTSTYLSNTLRGQHDAMEAYEERVLRSATEGGTEGQARALANTPASGKTQENTQSDEPATVN